MPRRILLLALVAGAVVAQTSLTKSVSVAPVQPIPYSHKQHLALGLQCKDCHYTAAEPADDMVLPAVAKCMTCHVSIKKDSPNIQKLAQFKTDGKEVPWVRVYHLPDYVDFSHKEHLAKAKATCDTCHGPVKEREAIRKESDISMAGCIDCHRSNNAPVSCNFCHESR
jgi:Cytochrome c7 and related cytochrome c/Class III cytochrome C family